MSNPVHILHDSLEEKGYRRIARYSVGKNSGTNAFALYSKSGKVVLMQEYTDNGCEIFVPVTDSNSIEDTIKAIDK